MIIRVGTEIRLSAAYQQYAVNLLIVHENYDKESFENDIALMKVKETFTLSENFRAICFYELNNLPVASSGIAVGYGSTDQDLNYSDVLRQVEISVVSQEDCLDSDYHFFEKHLFRGNFCAGNVGVQKGVCSGDSGIYTITKYFYLNSFDSEVTFLKVVAFMSVLKTTGTFKALHQTPKEMTA